MGQGVSSDGSQTETTRASVSQDLSSPHHVKAWRFEMRGKSIVEAPVSLCDHGGHFSAHLHRSSSYVILHLHKPEAAAVVRPFGIAALNDFAAEAGAACTPRGLGRPEVRVSNKSQVSPGLSHEIFVWHGRSTELKLRAVAQCKAFELDGALSKDLLQHKDVSASLRQCITIKGCQEAATKGGTQQPSEELSSNSLLSQLTTGVPDKARTKWTRLSQAIRRAMPERPNGVSRREAAQVEQGLTPSLPLGSQGSAVPKAIGGAPPQVPTLSIPQTGTGAPPQVPTLSIPQTGTGARPQVPTLSIPQPGAGKPVVPKLALNSIPARHSSPSSPTRQWNADPSPSASRSSADSSDMEVDEVDSSSRKRHRDSDEEERTPQTARGANAQGATSLGSVVRSAREARDATNFRGQLASNEDSSVSRVPPLANGRPTILGRSDAPALNLEDIHTPEEELINSYDPDNEENNYHLPDHLQRRLQLKHWRQVCSEVIPGALFISSYQVAGDEEALNASNITHIVNTAADVCDNCFPEKFQYLTYYLKDANSEDITVLLYKTMEWIHEAINKGGHVLVHCREGVSRSATIVIAYLMWRFSLSFEAAHERIRQNRPICNPNTGFTCQLLQLAKKLSTGQAAPMSDRSSLYRVAPYHPKEPFLLLVPADIQSGQTHFDPRFGWVAFSGLQLILWMGSQVPDADAVREAVEAHKRRVEFFERCQCSLLVVREGEEVPQLWNALGIPGVECLVALRSEFDADYDLMVATRSGRGSPNGHERPDFKEGSAANAAWEGPSARHQPLLAVGS